MGAECYWYYIDYQSDVPKTLEALREREFKTGRYNPVLDSLEFPITADSPSPGAQHSSIEAAHLALWEELGSASRTRSILDIESVSDSPFPRENWENLLESSEDPSLYFCKTYPLSESDLFVLFDTDKPTHEMIESVLFGGDQNVEAKHVFWNIERGTCKHIIVFDQDIPTEIFFVGYSFD